MSTYAVIAVVLVVLALALALPIIACERRLQRMYGDDSRRLGAGNSGEELS